MLTIEIIKAVPGLATLNEDQIKLLTDLSSNDEQQVIGNRIGEVYRQIDSDIAAITGNTRDPKVKTYDYLKSELGTAFKKSKKSGDTGKLEAEIATLKTQKQSLEKQIKEGTGDVALRNRITELETKVTDKTSEVNRLRTDTTKQLSDLQQELATARQAATEFELRTSINTHLAKSGVKFLDTIPEDLLNDLLETKKNEFVNSFVMDKIDDGKGGKKNVLRDPQTKEILRNPQNSQFPYSPGELYLTKVASLLDTGKKQPGGGTKPPTAPGGGGQAGAGNTIDLGGAATQVDADEAIINHLIQKEGMTKLSPGFSDRQIAIRTEMGVANLPATADSAAQ